MNCAACGTPVPKGGRQPRRFCSENCRKRHWERTTYRTACVDCGADISAKAKRCWACEQKRLAANRLERWAVIKALWDGGFLMREIVTFPEARRSSVSALGVELDRMKHAGIEMAPRRKGWKGGYTNSGPPKRPTTDHKLVAQRLGEAVRRGKVVRPKACERCGAEVPGLHGHHHDYSKPLDVEWLCPKCHMAHHVEERAAA